MSRGWQYKPGDWNITCDVCSRQIKASESRHRWDGFIVCKEDWEPRHPQDFIRTRVDRISVPFSRPEPADVFLDDPVPGATFIYYVFPTDYAENASDYFEEIPE